MAKGSFFNTLSGKIKDDGMLRLIDTAQTFSGAAIPYGVRTGVPLLDLALGRPGWAAGRVTELYGFEGCGKTTLGLHAIAQVQKMGGIGIFVDSEMTFDPVRAQQVGVQLNYGENFIRIEADTVEAGFRAIDSTVETIKDTGESRPIVVLYDSVTGSNIEYNINKDVQIGIEGRIGQEARSIRNGMRTITSKVAKTKIVLILINHAVAKIAAVPYAKASQSAGGHAIKLFASTRCELKKIGKIKDEDKHRIGEKTSILVEKSKVGGLSVETVEADLLNTSGFDTVGNMLEAARASGMVEWPKGAKVGTLQYIEPGATVSKADWSGFVESVGGIDIVYDKFYEWCIEKKLILPYGVSLA